MTSLERHAARILFALSAILLVAAIFSTFAATRSFDPANMPVHLEWMTAGVAVEIFTRQVGWAALTFGLASIIARSDRKQANRTEAAA